MNLYVSLLSASFGTQRTLAKLLEEKQKEAKQPDDMKTGKDDE